MVSSLTLIALAMLLSPSHGFHFASLPTAVSRSKAATDIITRPDARSHLVGRRSLCTVTGTASSMPEGEMAPTYAVNEDYNAFKNDLLLACCLCDRGFSATMKERDEISQLISKLGQMKYFSEPTMGVNGDNEVCHLRGVWRLVYTSAIDVLNLAASPFTSAGAIYQDIRNPPEIVNVIDQVPRALALLPPSRSIESTLRLRVTTRAKARSSNRVALSFERVKAEPKTLFGQDVSFLPAPQIDLPRISLFDGSDESPAYFDILFLDKDLLIIKQNTAGPGVEGAVVRERILAFTYTLIGGIFVSTKVDPEEEPIPL